MTDKEKMLGYHVTYVPPEGKQLLSYWLTESRQSKLKGYCGKYQPSMTTACTNCGQAKEDHKLIQVADCVYYSTDGFGQKRQCWRVTQHYKRHIHPMFYKQKPAADDWMERFTYEFIEETLLKTKMQAWQSSPHRKFQYCFTWRPCRAEEAEAVGLVAVCGAIAPLECCEFDRVVPWSEKMIQEERESALRGLNYERLTPHTDYMWTDEPLPKEIEL